MVNTIFFQTLVNRHILTPRLILENPLNIVHQSLQNQFAAIDLRFAINSFGRTPQDEILKYPSYGVGLTHYYLNSDTIGNPYGVYGFFASPFLINNPKLHLGWELATGFSFHFNKFDLITNPKNDVIGSNINVYFNLSLWAAIKMSERLDLLLTSDFTHFSNGTMNTPNKGLNLLGGNLGLRYHFQFEEKGKDDFKRKTTGKNTFDAFKPYNEFSLWMGLGGKAVLNPTYDGAVYLCSTVSTDFNHRYGWLGKYGLGPIYFMMDLLPSIILTRKIFPTPDLCFWESMPIMNSLWLICPLALK